MTLITTSTTARADGPPTAHDNWSLAAKAEASLATIRARKAAMANRESGSPAAKDDRQTELDSICETLRQTDVFANLDDHQLRRLARGCVALTLPARHMVFSTGDPSDSVFVVREGSVNVLRDQRGKPFRLLARLNAGDIFGELGVLHNAGRSASVRTAERCRLLRIGRETFRRLLKENAATEAKLEALATQRHCFNAAAALDSRKDPRIRIDASMVLVPAAEGQRQTRLEDISRGGLSLTGVPASWQPDERISFTLIADGRRLCVTGRVAWRRGETLGIAFSPNIPGTGHRVAHFTRALLEELD